MPTIGLIGLLVAFAGVAVSVVCLIAGAILSRKKPGGVGETLTWGGHVAVLLSMAALTVCCAILVYCFFSGDMGIEYVLRYHSDSSTSCRACGPAAKARCCSGRGSSRCSTPWLPCAT